MTLSLQSAPPPSSPFRPLSPDVPLPQDSLLHIHGGATVLIRTSPLSAQGCASRVAARSQGAAVEDWKRVPSLPALLRRGLQCLRNGLLARSRQAPDFLSFAVISQHWGPVPGPPLPQDQRRPQDHVPANLDFQSLCSQVSHLAPL